MEKKLKKCSLRNEKLKAKRASEAAEQRKEWRKAEDKTCKDCARRRTKISTRGKKSSSETEDNQKQRLAALKRLKRGDE